MTRARSAREGDPTGARFWRDRGLIARHRGAHSEHIERIGARRMHFADEYRAHQFMVAFAKECAIGIKRDVAGQLCSSAALRASFTASSDFSWLAIWASVRTAGVAEPVAGARGLAGATAHGVVEGLDPPVDPAGSTTIPSSTSRCAPRQAL